MRYSINFYKDDESIASWNQKVHRIMLAMPKFWGRGLLTISDYEKAVEDVISCGFSTILTSGTFPNVMEGKEVLKQLVKQANNRIEIMPGGGLRSTNISELDEMVNTNWYHSSAITDGSEIANSEEIAQLKKKLQS